jgi:hypothetical protein
LGHVTYPQASHQIEAVDLDRPDADAQMAGDFTVRQPLRHEAQDSFLARRQGLRRAFSGYPALRPALLGPGSRHGPVRLSFW